jgi:hypothetical protein
MRAIEAAARASGTPIDVMRAFTRTLIKRHEAAKKPATTVALREQRRKAEDLTPQLEAEFKRGGMSADRARIAAAGRRGLREVVTKHEPAVGDFKGGDFPASDYAYAPDKQDPSTWQLQLTVLPGGQLDPDSVRAAVQAIDPANPADNPVPEDELPAVIAKLARCWTGSGLPAEEMPAILTAESLRAEFRRGGVTSTTALSAAVRGRQARRI